MLNLLTFRLVLLDAVKNVLERDFSLGAGAALGYGTEKGTQDRRLLAVGGGHVVAPAAAGAAAVIVEDEVVVDVRVVVAVVEAILVLYIDMLK